MATTIVDTIPSFKINKDGGPSIYIFKEEIEDISVVNGSVMLDYGADTQRSVSFKAADVTIPSNTGAEDLAAQLSALAEPPAGAGAFEYIGEYNAATNVPDLDVSPSGVKKGDTYEVTTPGVFFTENMEVGDVIISKQDDPTVLSDWMRVNKNVNLIDFQQTLYVGKHGDDSNDGLRPEKAFLTFAAAINEAVTQLFPSDTNRVAIVCEDGGSYSEGIAIPSFVHVFAPNATLIGGQIVNDDSFLHIGRLTTILPTALTKASGLGDATVVCDEIDIPGVQLPVLVLSGDLHLRCSRIICNAIAAVASTSSGNLTIDIDHITCNTSPSFGTIAQFGTGNIRGTVRRIEDTALTGGMAFNFGSTGSINVLMNHITCVQLFNNPAGTLDVLCNVVIESAASAGAGVSRIRTNNPARAELSQTNNAAVTTNPGIGTFTQLNIAPTAGTLREFSHNGTGQLTYNGFRVKTFDIELKVDISSSVAGLTQFIGALFVGGVLNARTEARASKIANTANVCTLTIIRRVSLRSGFTIDFRAANQTNINNWTAVNFHWKLKEVLA